jgi:hypothetical protein
MERFDFQSPTLAASLRPHELRWEIGQRVTLPPGPYRDFGRLVRRLRTLGHSVAVMTFNYDLAVDYALAFNELEIDYCLKDSASPNPASVPLVKLHGSVGWARCAQRECGAVIPLQAVSLVQEHLKEIKGSKDFREVKSIPIPVGHRLTNLQHCGRACNDEALIVPPTWNKDRHYQEISSVWRRAASELREAENVFVIGYSWPETDYFFHHLYALGTVGPTLLRRFWLIGNDAKVRDRYQKLLGQQSLQRFHWPGCKFEDAIPFFVDEFRLGDFERT